MKVLFIPPLNRKHPLSEAVVTVIGKQYPLEIYDPDKPLAEQLQGVEVVVEAGGESATRELMDAGVAAGVKLWQVTTTGLDHVDVAFFLEKGMPLAHSPGSTSAVPLAEHALFFMLCFAKKKLNSPKVEGWNRPLSEELEGKTLGLIGLGASGRELAKRAWPMGMRIMAIDITDVPQAVRDELHVEFFGNPSQLDQVLIEADYLSLHAPLTSKTTKMIDRRAFQLMKPTAVLINVARGGLVDEEALVEALKGGGIRGAGLDVAVQEPLDPGHPLSQMDNVIATSHVGAFTRGTSWRRAEAAAENIARIAQGLPPLYQITSLE